MSSVGTNFNILAPPWNLLKSSWPVTNRNQGTFWRYRPRSIYQYSNMAPRLSGQTSIFGVVSFVSKSLMGIEGQKKLEKFAILTRKTRSHAWILIYRTWPITSALAGLRHEWNCGALLVLQPSRLVVLGDTVIGCMQEWICYANITNASVNANLMSNTGSACTLTRARGSW